MPEPTQGRVSSATFTPAAAAYSASDIFEGKKEFANIGPILGGSVIINSSELLISETALQASEAGYTLHLYSVTPPSNLADNAAFDIPSGDRAAYLGSIDLGTPIDLGSSLYVQKTGIGRQLYVPASTNGGSLFGYLVTAAGFTATATARKVTLHTQRI